TYVHALMRSEKRTSFLETAPSQTLSFATSRSSAGLSGLRSLRSQERPARASRTPLRTSQSVIAFFKSGEVSLKTLPRGRRSQVDQRWLRTAICFLRVL